MTTPENPPDPWSAPSPRETPAAPSWLAQPGPNQPPYQPPWPPNQPPWPPAEPVPAAGPPAPGPPAPGPTGPWPTSGPWNPAGPPPPGYRDPAPQYPPQYPAQYPAQSYPARYPAGSGSRGPAAARGSVRRTGQRTAAVVGLVVVVIAGLLAGSWFAFLRKPAPALTWQGKQISQPETVLSAAEASLQQVVNTRHGASGKDARCYFAQPKRPAEGAKKSDVAPELLCGPVLFVDGDAKNQYVRFALSARPAKDKKVELSAATTPTAADPMALPADRDLARPDKVSAPSVAGGLSVPAPPPAAANLLATVDIGGQTLPAPGPNAVIGARTGGIKLTGLGKVPRIGRGDAARSAPTGQEFIAFTYAPAVSANGGLATLGKATVRIVAGGIPRGLPTGSEATVVAVAIGQPAQLRVTEAGSTQTISLRTGQPGANNVVVGRRTRHTQSINRRLPLNFTESASGDSIPRTARVDVQDARLTYWSPLVGDNRHASSPGRAFLYLDATFTFTNGPRGNFTESGPRGPFGIPTSQLELRLPDGRTLAARNYAITPGKIFNLYEVPPTFTTGTVVIRGAATNRNGVKFTVRSPVNIPVTIPA